MESRLSEFSYGFSLTYELISLASGRLVGAPEFPSLIKEGRLGGGYDVRIGFFGRPMFFQFKLSEYMVSPKAGEWGKFNDKYFRFWITPRNLSRQHRWLINLENKGNRVYYAAPAFYKVKSLNKAFMGRNVVARSVFVRPMQIGLLTDDRWHCIAFRYKSPTGHFCSEPREISVITGKEIFHDIQNYSGEIQENIINEDYLHAMYRQMHDIIFSDIEESERGDLSWLMNIPVLDRIYFISRTILGCELLFTTTA